MKTNPLGYVQLIVNPDILRILLRYGVSFGLFLYIIMASLSWHMDWTNYGARRNGTEEKVEHVLKHREKLDLYFIGDSRTYCNIHPEFIDPILGSHSYNLAFFGFWFPSQYPYLQTILPLLPKQSTVVWSIGHQNFFSVSTCGDLHYPMTTAQLFDYFLWGAKLCEIGTRYWRSSRVKHFWDRSKWNYQRLSRFTEKKLLDWSTHPPILSQHDRPNHNPTSDPLQTAFKVLAAPYRKHPGVEKIEYKAEHGKIVSLTLLMQGGGYYRIEIEPEFFRSEQRAFAKDNPQSSNEDPSHVLPNPLRMRLFEEILDLFTHHGIRLIVNELEEAPFTYGSPQRRQQWHDFMDKKIRPIVENHHFPYIRLPLEQLNDADYFDFNHMNSQGIAKYTPMLANGLRAYLPPRKTVE
ncbi:MAG: hypothetical protein HQL79_06945 [Magnetococcales bacterium]|nr:hypothetical protein [Magnetococcales bacterium]